jgi:hypothetical protein
MWRQASRPDVKPGFSPADKNSRPIRRWVILTVVDIMSVYRLFGRLDAALHVSQDT